MDKLRKKVNSNICSKYSEAQFIILNKDFKSENFPKLVQFSRSKCIYFHLYIIIYIQSNMIINSDKF